MRHRVALTFVSFALAAPVALLPTPAWAEDRAKPYDFNGDGYPELVVGAPHLQVGSHPRAGGLVVLPASRRGLARKARLVTQSSRGVVGASEEGDVFGAAFASADFNKDGYADLAVGQPGEHVDGAATGGVTILFGSGHGLRGKKSFRLQKPDGGTVSGSSLAAADFDGDGWTDLAVANPGADYLPVPDEDFGASGVVSVFFGGPLRFSAARSSILHGRRTQPGFDVGFGTALAVGDLDGDGRDDLVVGSRGESFSDGDGYDGSVSACFGPFTESSGCVQLAHSYALAGFDALAVGNVSGSPRPEIVAGVPSAELQESPGTVLTLSLSGEGLATTATVSALTQESPGVPGEDQDTDNFGADVVLGDLDHDGYADLVVGSPSETVGTSEFAGQVVVVYGGSAGYGTAGGLIYSQDTTGIPGKAEARDSFGARAALFDHNADGHLDLTVSAPGENGGTGAVTTLAGHATSFTTKGARTFTLRTVGDVERSEANFGEVLGR